MKVGSINAALKEYTEELGTFDIFRLINRQLLSWPKSSEKYDFVKSIYLKSTSGNHEYFYQGMMTKDGVADGIGRTICPVHGIYEGQFVDGQPKGWGSVIDNKLNHYEGFVKTTKDGTVVCEGDGTLMHLDKSIKGSCKTAKEGRFASTADPSDIYDLEFK